jgi:hypothetical protein
MNESRIKLFARIGLCPEFKTLDNYCAKGDECTFQQEKNDPNEITKSAKEEWDQSNLRLANYA